MTVLNPSRRGAAAWGCAQGLPVPRLLGDPEISHGHGSDAREQHLARARSCWPCARRALSSLLSLSQRCPGVAVLGCDLRGINFSCSSSTQPHPPPLQRISMNSWAHYKHVSINNSPH